MGVVVHHGVTVNGRGGVAGELSGGGGGDAEGWARTSGDAIFSPTSGILLAFSSPDFSSLPQKRKLITPWST